MFYSLSTLRFVPTLLDIPSTACNCVFRIPIVVVDAWYDCFNKRTFRTIYDESPLIFGCGFGIFYVYSNVKPVSILINSNNFYTSPEYRFWTLFYRFLDFLTRFLEPFLVPPMFSTVSLF